MPKRLKLLLIEDSEDDTLLILRELRRGGFDPDCERVETPEAMAAALAKRTWDLVISDYVLPRFSGIDALTLFKESGLDLPFVIVSGHIGEEIAVAAMRAGAHDYLIKGNLARLAPAVERELREAEGRRKRRRAEEELEQYRHHLEDMVEKRTAELEATNGRLQQALTEVKTLEGLLPICAACKKIRDDAGDWTQLEAYISCRSKAQFSHGICPDCARRLYPEIYAEGRSRP